MSEWIRTVCRAEILGGKQVVGWFVLKKSALKMYLEKTKVPVQFYILVVTISVAFLIWALCLCMWGSVYVCHCVDTICQLANLWWWNEIAMTHDFGSCFVRFYWVEGWIHVKLLCSDSEAFGLLTGNLLVERLKKNGLFKDRAYTRM